MANIPDGRYDRMTAGNNDPLSFKRPYDSHEEMLCARALESVVMPMGEIQMIPCPLPQVALFPPRFGYGDTVPGIEDVINLNRMTQTQVSFSGVAAGYTGSSRNSLGTES